MLKTKDGKTYHLMGGDMFRRLMTQPWVCEEMLQVIFEDKNLKTTSSVPQSVVREVRGNAVIAKTTCITGSGARMNVTIVRIDDAAYVKESVNASIQLICNAIMSGVAFEDMLKTRLIYLSERDLFGVGLCKYRSRIAIQALYGKNVKTTEDMLEAVFVNAQMKDGSETSEYMSCLLEEDSRDV